VLTTKDAGSGDARMTQPAKSQEPSMEEILASIRRIIADDDASKRVPEAPKAAGVAPKPGAPPQELLATSMPGPVDFVPSALKNGLGGPAADILELTDSMASPVPRTAPDMGFGEGTDKPRLPNGHDVQSQLLSRSTTAAVDSAFSTLAQTALPQNARSLEDLVREMLRPLLKAWLDENLPGMVERLVRSEIERVARGR
jgi:cell pole-organizing protein PopZ